jgi:hypothetical protein
VRRSTKSTITNKSQEYTAAVTLKKVTAIEARKISGNTQDRIWNALIVLGSMPILARFGFPETYHHTELKSSLVMPRLPA